MTTTASPPGRKQRRSAPPVRAPEWAGGAFAALRDFFAPAVIGRDFASGSEGLQDALAAFKGHQFAKALLDIAWYESLQARSASL